MNVEKKLNLFGMSNLMLENDLSNVAKKFSINLKGNKESGVKSESHYFLQFDSNIRQEASEMAQYYEAFYCLEKSIRELIAGRLKEAAGGNWWTKKVSQKIKEDVQINIDRELDAGVTVRSNEEIDYTTFGQLSGIIVENWNIFGDQFNSKKGLQKVMSNLNVLRGPIAHCSPLAPREVIRLQITIEDWFGLME